MDELRSVRVGVESDPDDRENVSYFAEMKTRTRTTRLVFPDYTEALNFYGDWEKKLGITAANFERMTPKTPNNAQAMANFLRTLGYTVSEPEEKEE